jgi:hypothetical protein
VFESPEVRVPLERVDGPRRELLRIALEAVTAAQAQSAAVS